jgi:hypothetical protein
MWVEFAQYIADNAGAFYVWTIPNIVHQMLRIEYSPMHRL